jgi:hypothetical protein
VLSPATDQDRTQNRRGAIGPAQRAYLHTYASGAIVARINRTQDLLADLERGSVACTEGDVLFARGRVGHLFSAGAWFARTADGRERDIWMERVPLPGHHTLYVLPQSGHVIGTEEETAQHYAAYRAMLASVQELSPSDLEAVERHIIPSRLAAITRRPPNFVDTAMFTFMFVLGALTGLLAPVIAMSDDRRPLVPAIILSVAFLVAGWFLGVRKWARIWAAGRSGRTRAIDGLLRKETRSKPATLLFKVGELSVDVTNRGALYEVVCEGLPHRLHLTDANVLVAIEAPQ